jgi:hypothetical protein
MLWARCLAKGRQSGANRVIRVFDFIQRDEYVLRSLCGGATRRLAEIEWLRGDYRMAARLQKEPPGSSQNEYIVPPHAPVSLELAYVLMVSSWGRYSRSEPPRTF